MPRPSAIVYVIDDDASVRTALERLMRSARLEVKLFESVRQFLNNADLKRPACVVADVRMPGESSLDLPASLARKGCQLPVIYVTAHDTEETRKLAHEVGAAGYFRKPVDDQALLDAIQWALGQTADSLK